MRAYPSMSYAACRELTRETVLMLLVLNVESSWGIIHGEPLEFDTEEQAIEFKDAYYVNR